MKRFTLFIVLALFIQTTVSAQFGEACLPDGITFTTQDQIDNFQTNYPNCTEIEGDVKINGNEITNLNGLQVVTSFGGELRIASNNILTSLTGLDNMTSIGGDLEITSNKVLITLSGLDNVTSIGGSLKILNNDSLTNLTGLDNVTSIGGDLWISSNDFLSSCEAQWLCDYLSNPNGSVNIYDNASGCNNPPEVANACGITLPCLPFGNYYLYTQTEIDNFPTNYPNCNQIDGDVLIIGDDITNINGLSVLTSFEGDLQIGRLYSGTKLTSLTGLDNVTSIGGGLGITNCDSLTSLTGLDNLTSIGGGLGIGGGNGVGNTKLTSLTGLEGLTTIGGDLKIGGLYSGTQLTSLTGLDNLTSIGGELKILFNGTLTNLAGLNNLTTIGGGIFIAGNELLTNLTGLENITSIQGRLKIGGDDWYSHGNNLTTLSGLDNVTSIGGYISIDHCDVLTSLTGLDNVTSIGGDLSIHSSSVLTSLTGLENVTSIGGGLWIYYTSSLTSLMGLNNVTSIGGELKIVNNNNLSACEIESVCNYLANPNGEIEIHDNAPGCNSLGEVEEACLILSVDEIVTPDYVKNYPNPFSTSTTIEYDLIRPTIIKIIIYNQFGGKEAVIEAYQAQGLNKLVWTPKNLPNGIYYFRLQAGEQVAQGKIVLMK